MDIKISIFPIEYFDTKKDIYVKNLCHLNP